MKRMRNGWVTTNQTNSMPQRRLYSAFMCEFIQKAVPLSWSMMWSKRNLFSPSFFNALSLAPWKVTLMNEGPFGAAWQLEKRIWWKTDHPLNRDVFAQVPLTGWNDTLVVNEGWLGGAAAALRSHSCPQLYHLSFLTLSGVWQHLAIVRLPLYPDWQLRVVRKCQTWIYSWAHGERKVPLNPGSIRKGQWEECSTISHTLTILLCWPCVTSTSTQRKETGKKKFQGSESQNGDVSHRQAQLVINIKGIQLSTDVTKSRQNGIHHRKGMKYTNTLFVVEAGKINRIWHITLTICPAHHI